MPGLSSFAFLNPWLLLALAVLPALWLLLRVTPPAPRRVRFPAIRLLTGLVPPEETAARTPVWILLLRMAALGLLILGLAGPVLHPVAGLSGSGPLVLVIDNGWAAAKNWAARQEAVGGFLDRARRDGRRVVVMTTAPTRAQTPLTASDPLPPEAARERVGALAPRPWPRDLAAARAVAANLRLTGSAHAVWVSDGLAAPGARDFARQLQRLGRLDVVRTPAESTARVILPPGGVGRTLDVPLRRASGTGAVPVTVLAESGDGAVLASAETGFAAGETAATATLSPPLALRNRIARVRLAGEGHAGAVALLDARWRRGAVGLAAPGGGDDAQPLLSEVHYLDRALAPYAEITRAPVADLLRRELSLLVLADRGVLPQERRSDVRAWVNEGGVLLRFAGPKLAESLSGGQIRGGQLGAGAAADPLLPVPLRRGGRALGGAMSWDQPARLAPFPDNGPFAGLSVSDDVSVRRQVLAEPSLGLDEAIWARLADGTPLVTARRAGEGWLVLVHTTANTQWSDLPLSGLFVRMLRRIAALGGGESASDAGERATLAPHRVLDGRGRLQTPPAGVRAVAARDLETADIAPTRPPGLYGPPGGRRALNLGPRVADLAPLSDLPPGVRVQDPTAQPERPLGPWLLAATLLLLLADLLIALMLRGVLPWPSSGWGGGAARTGRRGTAAALLAAGTALVVLAAPASAQDSRDGSVAFAQRATQETRLAYLKTGVAEVDRVAREGLAGLTQVLTRRTAVEPGAPMGVNPRRDPLSVFPFLYWPITARQPDLAFSAVERINKFLANGGTILFDLREADTSSTLFGRASKRTQALRRLTREIAIPPLMRVDGEHVLTRAFYLLQAFPGRYAGGTLWVEDTAEAPGDGVASVIVGSGDWAGAWAVDEAGRPRYAVTPGRARQREMARRVGVNVVMYALTGNYKADQVHVPAILERLGQ